MRALIADDEVLSRDELKYLLSTHPGIKVCGEAATGEQVIQLCRRLQPDVVFLDIQMPGRNGLLVARELLRQPNPPLIVFATAYDQHALEAFQIEAIDYLLKPFSAERIHNTISRIQRNLLHKNQTLSQLQKLLARLEQEPQVIRLTADKDGRLILLKHREVAVAYAEGRSVFLKTADERLRTSLSLQELQERLPSPPFFRCHRGFLVNLDWVKEIHPWFNGAYQLILADKQQTQVPVSRLSVKDLRSALNI